MKGRGHPVIKRGIWLEVARQLPDRELVERHVGVERADHPVAPAPDRAVRIVGIAGTVGVSRQVEPLAGHVLAVARMGEQAIDELSHGVGRRIGDEGVDFLGRHRQPREVEGEPPRERGPVGLGLGREPLHFEPSEDEPIDVVFGPRRVVHRGHGRPRRRHIGPVPLVGRPGRDPSLQEIDLLLGQPLARLWRWHDEIGISGGDPCDDRAFVRLPRHDRSVATEIGGGTRERVETQPIVATAVAILGVGPMAPHAAVGQDALDIPRERRAGCGCCGGCGQRKQSRRDRGGNRAPSPAVADRASAHGITFIHATETHSRIPSEQAKFSLQSCVALTIRRKVEVETAGAGARHVGRERRRRLTRAGAGDTPEEADHSVFVPPSTWGGMNGQWRQPDPQQNPRSRWNAAV